MTKKQKRNSTNPHNFFYNKAQQHALRAIYEGVDIKVDGQVFSYNCNDNILTIRDYCTEQNYHPKFSGIYCDPFAERIEYKISEV